MKPRSDSEGNLLCKVRRCVHRPLDGAQHRKMCAHHFATRDDGRGKCAHRGCQNFCCEPYTDRLCEFHHPAKRRLTPLESSVVQAVHDGADPVSAVQAVTGVVKRDSAARKLEHLSQSAAFVAATSEAMVKAGITQDFVFKRLREEFDADKHAQYEGSAVKLGPDHRARIQALDMSFKLTGQYAPKQIETKEAPTFNVVMLPEATPPSPDTPVYVIPAPKQADD